MIDGPKPPNLNQNLWALVVSFLGVGFAELYHLQVLFWLAFILGVVGLVSVVATTAIYTLNYWKKKS